MRNELETGRLDQPCNPSAGGRASTPGDVRLKHLRRAHLDEHVESVLSVLVLAARDLSPPWPLSPDASHQLGIAEYVVGGEQLLHEIEIRRAQALRERHGPLDGAVPRYAVGHHASPRPYRLANLEHRVDSPIKLGSRSVGPHQQASFEVPNPIRLALRNVATGLVEGNAVATGPAE